MLDVLRKNAQSWGVKIIFGLIIVVFVFWGVGNFGADTASVVAYVNGRPLLVKDFEKTFEENLRLAHNQNPNITDKELVEGGFRWQVFSQMLTQTILAGQAAKLNISVSDVELRREIARVPAFADEKGKFDAQKYEVLLKANGLNTAEFEADMRKTLTLEKLGGYITLPAQATEAEARGLYEFSREQAVIEYIPFLTDAFSQGITPPDDAIKAYYEANADKFKTPAQIRIEYLDLSPQTLAKPDEVSDTDIEAYYKANTKAFERPESVEVRHLLVMLAPNAPEAEVKAAEEKLAGLAERLRKGEDFASLLPKNPTEEDAVMGEDYAWLSRGALPKEFKSFEDAAFSLDKGKVGDPIRTTIGLHVMEVRDKRPAGTAPLDEVKDEVKSVLAEERAADRLTKVMDTVQDKVVAGIELAKAAEDEGLAMGQTQLFAKDQPPVNLKLAPQALETLFALAQGKTTDTPLTTEDGFLVAKVLEAKPAAVAPLEDVKDRIVVELVEKEALKRAKEKAEAAASEMKTPEGVAKVLAEYKANVVLSQPFTRQGFIPGLGMVPPLAKAAFDQKTTDWMPQVFAVSDGYVLARPEKRIAPDPAAWNADKDKWMQSLFQSKQSELFRAYLTTIQEEAKIEMVNAEILGPRPGGDADAVQ
ncbi:SurA N-terminal domain-containing protein [Desulfolutivibrio sulfoxidireducens]|uniref:SurA N-terminal domain-containing protein n=1 Tax=Desulfolutivibrio sulfoxidireducens TaxID=2773299 RepID=UPI00159E62D1|nr:SurA N-terminal domain-containing protein [Desulfolutivibrio sulfoxidireducens]QLA17401.1 peptidylprolyl isomerase [Desulfolutivibrio sulfoxidireducens]